MHIYTLQMPYKKKTCASANEKLEKVVFSIQMLNSHTFGLLETASDNWLIGLTM